MLSTGRTTRILAKEERGSVMITVMISFLLAASILGATTVMVPVLWRNTTAFGRQMLAMQAAESGLEHAKAWIKVNGLAKFGGEYPHTPTKAQHAVADGGSFTVVYADGRLISTATYAGVKRTVSAAVASTGHPTAAIYGTSGDDGKCFEMMGSAKIDGSVAVAATGRNSVSLKGSSEVTGDFLVGPGGNPAQVISGREHIRGDVDALAATPSYLLPPFPSFPKDKSPRDDVSTKTKKEITESGYYPKITVEKGDTLTFDVSAGDLEIWTSSLDLKNGHIQLVGEHRLYLYVDGKVNLQQGSTINSGGDSEALVVYYSDKHQIKFHKDTTFVGTLYVGSKDAKLEFASDDSESEENILGGSRFRGSIISAGESITFKHGASFEGMLYAPDARLSMRNSASISGSLVSKSIEMRHASMVTYEPVDVAGIAGIGIPAFEDGEISFAGWRVVNP